jgi:ABC-type transporter Mla subunit MlaD
VQGAGRSIGALDSSEAALGGLIDSADSALRVTAGNQSDLGSIIAQAPGTLSETRATMSRLRRTLDALDPLATKLTQGVTQVAPAVTAATPTMRELTSLVPSAVPALTDLQPALVSLRNLAAAGDPLMAQFSPTLTRTSSQIIPFLNERSSTTKLRNYEAIGPFFSAVDSSASTFDSGGFMQRFQPGQRLGTSTEIPPSACTSLGQLSSPPAVKACQSVVAALNNALIQGVKLP